LPAPLLWFHAPSHQRADFYRASLILEIGAGMVDLGMLVPAPVR
jgi:hypothetical protein